MPKKEIKIGDSFRTMVEAANALGCKYQPKGIRKGGVMHPNIPETMIWFPKLFKNANWDNSISKDEKTIVEKSVDNPEGHKNMTINSSVYTRFVFAKMDSNGQYIFVGKYELNINESNKRKALVWKQVATTV